MYACVDRVTEHLDSCTCLGFWPSDLKRPRNCWHFQANNRLMDKLNLPLPMLLFSNETGYNRHRWLCHNIWTETPLIRQKCHNAMESKSLWSRTWVMLCPSMWPKQFWSEQIDLDLTKMNWSGPNCDFLPKWIPIWTWPIHFGRHQIIMVKSKSIWSDQNHFGPTKTVLATQKDKAYVSMYPWHVTSFIHW